MLRYQANFLKGYFWEIQEINCHTEGVIGKELYAIISIKVWVI